MQSILCLFINTVHLNWLHCRGSTKASFVSANWKIDCTYTHTCSHVTRTENISTWNSREQCGRKDERKKIMYTAKRVSTISVIDVRQSDWDPTDCQSFIIISEFLCWQNKRSRFHLTNKLAFLLVIRNFVYAVWTKSMIQWQKCASKFE